MSIETQQICIHLTRILKKQFTPAVYLIAEISQPSRNLQDAITGTMEFRGTIGKQVEVKTDKKGKPYTLFSAYSSEKDGDNYAYTWIRFMQFDTTKADWVQAKAGINAKGDLQVGAYNDRLDLTCRVTELSPWEKKAASTNQ